MSCSVVFLCVFALSANCVSSKTLRNALLLDAKIDYQRDPWMTADVRKSSSVKGFSNFKFDFHVWRDIYGAVVNFQKKPLLPLKLSDGSPYDLSTTDSACAFIKEDFYGLFVIGNFSTACGNETYVMRKGNYTFEYNVDGAKFARGRDIGTAVYHFAIEHFGGPLLVMTMLVDTDVLALRKYEQPQKQTTSGFHVKRPKVHLKSKTKPHQSTFNLERLSSQQPKVSKYQRPTEYYSGLGRNYI